MLQFKTQLTEFGDAGFDERQFVLEELSHRVFRILGMPERGDTAADLAKGKAQALGRLDVEHQLQHFLGVVAVAIGAALGGDQPALLVEAQGIAADGAGQG
ncbi:hypothetical protein D3C80_1689250 [compost metagenome]